MRHGDTSCAVGLSTGSLQPARGTTYRTCRKLFRRIHGANLKFGGFRYCGCEFTSRHSGDSRVAKSSDTQITV